MPVSDQFTPPQRSLRTRMFVTFTVFTAIICVTFTSIYTFREIREHRLRSEEKALLLATRLATAIRLPLYADNREELELQANETAKFTGVHSVSIINSDGKIVVQAIKPKTAQAEVSISSIVDVTPEPMGKVSETMLDEPFAHAGPLGKVRVDFNDLELKAAIRSQIASSSLIALVFCLISTVICYLIVRWLTRSLNPLTAGIRAMREGDYASRIRTTSHDELGEIAEAVNELASELHKREETNKRLQQELIDSMKNEVREEQRKMMAKLIQTNRMTSLGLLVSSMAHEINTPNGSISMSGDFLARALKDALPLLQQLTREEGEFSLGGLPFSSARDELLESCGSIQRNSERIAKVIQDLRSYSLGDRNEFNPNVDVNQVIASALAVIRAHGRHTKITINTNLASGLPRINGSSHQLEQVLVNCLLNALQSLPEGTGEAAVTTSYDRPAKLVTIAVSDDGEGIPPEHMGRLLEPFFSTRIDKGGSGLGLFVTNFIVHEHGGSMEIRSKPGVGTTVVIHLPAAQQV
jgi:two-component system NtrC family sensor kinase